MGTLFVKDLSDASGNTWIPIAGVGPKGPTGPPGPEGVGGPQGPTGPGADEVWIGIDPPDLVAMPAVELWYDPDDNVSLGPVVLPGGGLINQVLSKVTAADGDVGWSGPYLLQTGGALTGDLTVSGRTQVNGVLAAPDVDGDVNVSGALSAGSVEDRSFDRHLEWETWDVTAHWNTDWNDGDFQSGTFPGGAAVYRNAFMVCVNIAAHRENGGPESQWVDVIVPGSLPVGWRPVYDLWMSVQCTETDEASATMDVRVTNTGSIQVYSMEFGLDWDNDTRIPINFAYPRGPG